MAKYICEHCDETFNKVQDKANHIRWKHSDNSEYLNKLKEFSVKANETRFGKWVSETVKCNNCDTDVDIKYRENKKKAKYFCSRSCANSRGTRSNAVKDKISNSVSDAWKSGKFDHVDYTTTNKRFSSKTERLIVNHFKEKFPSDGWKSGGRKKIGDEIFIARDLYSDKLKVCFEYDGIWHFKDIYGQLEDKRIKDLALEEWCIKNKYRLIRVDENFFESVTQIEDLIYNRIESIIKVGNRY